MPEIVTVDKNKLMAHMRYRLINFSAEASELGWPVGEWPRTIKVPGVGNGHVFHAARKLMQGEGDLGGIVYRQLLGCVEVTVFND